MLRYFHAENSSEQAADFSESLDSFQNSSLDFSLRAPYPDSRSFPDTQFASAQRYPFPQYQQFMGRFPYPQEPPFSNSLIRAQPPMQQQTSYGQGDQIPYQFNQMYPMTYNFRPQSFPQRSPHPRPRHPFSSRAPRPHAPRPSPPSIPDSQQPVTVTDPVYTLDPLGSGAHLYRCTLCSVNCNSLQMWESHVVGRKHTHQVKLHKGKASGAASGESTAAAAVVEGGKAAAVVEGGKAAAVVEGGKAAAVVEGGKAAAVVEGDKAAAGEAVVDQAAGAIAGAGDASSPSDAAPAAASEAASGSGTASSPPTSSADAVVSTTAAATATSTAPTASSSNSNASASNANPGLKRKLTFKEKVAAGLIKKKEKIARTVVDLNCPICGNMKVNSLNMYLQHRAGKQHLKNVEAKRRAGVDVESLDSQMKLALSSPDPAPLRAARKTPAADEVDVAAPETTSPALLPRSPFVASPF